MTENVIRFDDGAAYERYMGTWSRSVGLRFLEWLDRPEGLRWLDVGCGNGAFTSLLVDRYAPAAVHGVDPAPAQLAYARERVTSSIAEFRQGDAMALPYPDDTFDAAVMPLVIFFVPDPAVGVAELARVVRPGGVVAAYAWDMPGGGFPYAALQAELRATGLDVPTPPSADASRLDVLQTLWADAGLVEIEARAFTVERTFRDFDDYWATVQGGPSAARPLGAIPTADRSGFKERLRERLPAPDDRGRITVSARANAVKGFAGPLVGGAVAGVPPR